MRIAMIGQRGVPARGGGVERVVEELGAELVERGHDITVFCRNPYVDSSLTTHRGMNLVHAKSLDSKHLEAISHAGVSTAQSLRLGFDIVHFHALGPGLMSPLIRYFSSARAVQTVHGLDDQRQKWGLAARTALSLGGKFSARVPDATIVLTEDLRRYYRWQRGQRAVTIPNGVRVQPPPPDWRERLRRLGLTPGNYALSVGRLVPEKAFDQLVDAFTGMDIDLDLVVVGGSSHTDSYAQELRTIAPHHPRLSFVGSRESEDLASIYQGAAFFVTASLLEGMPLVLLEALCHGLPVIASDIAPHREVLGADGPGRRFFQVGNSRSLKRAMAHMAANVESEQQAAEAAAPATLVKHSWSDVAMRTEAVYERVLLGASLFSGPADSLEGGFLAGLPSGRSDDRELLTAGGSGLAVSVDGDLTVTVTDDDSDSVPDDHSVSVPDDHPVSVPNDHPVSVPDNVVDLRPGSDEDETGHRARKAR